MILNNLSGITKTIFQIGVNATKKVFIGDIAGDGLLQGQDNDQRTTRDLIQYNPRWYLASGEVQIATHHEVHNLEDVVVTIDGGAIYELDEGAIVIM